MLIWWKAFEVRLLYVDAKKKSESKCKYTHIFFPSKYIFILKNKMKRMNQNKTREITNEFSHALVYYACYFLGRGYLENGTFK